MNTAIKRGANRAQYSLVGLVVLVVLFISLGVSHGQSVKAFPTAEGFGAGTVGGRGGRIIEVTNLNDSGPGSLRAALTATGPRIVVFRISGTINLQSEITLTETNSFVTVAGQTSPGGVQIRGAGIAIGFRYGVHDVVFRHVRYRPGGVTGGAQSGFISYTSGGAQEQYNLIFDHCSLQWFNDSGFNLYSGSRDITIQWSLIAEGHNNGSGNAHPYTIGGDVANPNNQRITLHHNLVAHFISNERHPFIQTSGIVDYVNNLHYNVRQPTWGSYYLNTSAFGNMVKNRYIAGANSSNPMLWMVANGGPTRLGGGSADRGGTKVYASGNWGAYLCTSGCTNDWSNGWYDRDSFESGQSGDITTLANESRFRAGTRFFAPPITETDVTNLQSVVLAKVGAYKPYRDTADQKVINDVNNRTGNFSSIGTGGPWPDLASGAPSAPTDTDHDGMPDSWETARGLNPNDATDGPRVAANGYTNVENYLNELAGDLIPGSSQTNLPPPSNLNVAP